MIKFDATALVADFRSLTAKIEGGLNEGVLRRVGFAGAEVFREEAKRNAARNVKTGTLYRNIIAKRLPEESDGANRQTYLVTVRQGKFNQEGDAYYWRWVESGHLIVKKTLSQRKVSLKRRRKFAAFLAENEFGNSRVPANPFMRPAYDSKKAEAIKVMQDKLGQEVSKAIGGGE